MKKQAVQGLLNEQEVIDHLNNKTFVMLDEKWQKHIKVMFPFVKDTDIIYARKFPEHKAKPDAIIKVRNSVEYLSIKSGRNPSVHQEDYFVFQNFLKYYCVPENNSSHNSMECSSYNYKLCIIVAFI